MQKSATPILGFAAYSGTGKTTLLTQLIPRLKQSGINVGIIKHSHHNFEIDKPGKDSYRLRKAGASPVLLVSAHRRAIITEFSTVQEPKLQDQLDAFEQHSVDLILVEGFKAEKFPKIEVYRTDLNKPLLYPDDDSIIAVASDTPLPLPPHVTALDLNNVEQIQDFVLRFMDERMKDLCLTHESGLLTLEQALQQIKHSLTPITACETIELKQALGRVLAETIYAPIDVPGADVSSMDGYAFSSQDIQARQPFRLKQIGVSWAGKPYPRSINPGECVRIFTGAVIPKGADSVIMQEQVKQQRELIEFPADCPAKRFIRRQGSDIKRGQVVLQKNRRLSPVDCALLASVGIYAVRVRRKIRVAYFSTGDELKSPGQTLENGQIYNSNRYALHGLLNNPNLSVSDLGCFPDDKQIIQTSIRQAAQDFDVLISTGGASVGDADFIADILTREGQINFWKLAIKPGKPLAFGQFGACYFFALPGNPVSAHVTFEKIIQPALAWLSGLEAIKPLRLSATLQADLKKIPGRLEFQRGIFHQDTSGDLRVSPADGQDSHQLGALSHANCYIVLEADVTDIKEGDRVIIEPFSTQL
ncbi:bifunctional molybdopterin-guanine dinucleotide biosynthesis adaptor protein MobB/molybdopterin molybdotransferase MoeA [methane-oxidizing endosymbiont of Gigantopelta aegis]|uniref:bifunctional molybdopterin-guanine dinucleotide biosynthesis adaptor protein MobB/molybdopterin molybdotransferase MoeA n=1 Tax=methane-oxidizing endosymbiont of Gigantopelta aegis TaxID=2794938 RepID=UPI0018DEB830|nr:bifunctional molybdopterin-guanine dinucleotide biosynthesis adaptor protein MobB/molybdopterin molybdotransferase MoeA [methane-oxidizing endosymbiont of Gigantopelta aegis]